MCVTGCGGSDEGDGTEGLADAAYQLVFDSADVDGNTAISLPEWTAAGYDPNNFAGADA